ncbi:cation-transporting ATPase [Microbacterium sp. NPDC008134]|uniref:cation-transporting ATPase n=1 Tax=Microbacterium sp. NPDC008134 TaxID=3364183 RepID=UPI0036E37B5B
MGKLSRLIGMATQALDLDSGDRSRHQTAPQTAAPRQPAGGHDPYAPPPAPGAHGSASRAGAATSDADRAAIARYDYLMQTADPQRIEQMHREAFERLTPAQRAQVQERMHAELPPHERPASASSDNLARAAGRAEAAKPGRMRGLLSRVGGGGRGGVRGLGAAGAVGGAAVGVLGAVAGGAVLSSVAGPLLDQAANLGVDFTALAEGVDLEAIAAGVDVDGFAGAAEGIAGTAGEAVSGLGETASGWGEKLGEFGLPDIRDFFGR